MPFEAIAQIVTEPTLGALATLPFTVVASLLGGAVGYGMVKGKIDATEAGLAKLEVRLEKRLDRVEDALDRIQSDLRNSGGRHAS